MRSWRLQALTGPTATPELASPMKSIHFKALLASLCPLSLTSFIKSRVSWFPLSSCPRTWLSSAPHLPPGLVCHLVVNILVLPRSSHQPRPSASHHGCCPVCLGFTHSGAASTPTTATGNSPSSTASQGTHGGASGSLLSSQDGISPESSMYFEGAQ